MRLVKNILIHAPAQILGICFYMAFLYILVRGILSVFDRPPDTKNVLIIMVLGIFLGILKSITDNSLRLPPDNTQSTP